ncbi:MAG: universal stress protein [Pseudolysinimonas sp.]
MKEAGEMVPVGVIADDDRDRLLASRWVARFFPGGLHSSDLLIISGPPSAARIALVEGCRGTVIWLPSGWIAGEGPIVAATGHELGSDAAIAPAIELTRHGSHAVVLAHVWAMPSLGVVELPQDPWGIGSIPDGQAAALQAFASRVQATAPDVSVTAVVRQGAHVARELLAIAPAVQAVVVGRLRAHGARQRLGTVARELLELGRCPVVIAPSTGIARDLRP